MILEPEHKIERDSQLIVDMANMALRNYHKYMNMGFTNTMDRRDVIREFCTVNIHLPRQSGHSTAGLQLLYEHDDALMFMHNGAARHHYENALKN